MGACVWLYHRHFICLLWIVHLQNNEKCFNIHYNVPVSIIEILDFNNVFHFHVYLEGTFTRPIQKHDQFIHWESKIFK